jgi:hypothetical protein
MAGGRPAAPTFVIPLDEILSGEEILGREYRLFRIYCDTSEVEKTVKWCVQHGLLRNVCVCKTCETHCNFVKSSKCVDQFMWHCKVCKKYYSIRPTRWVFGAMERGSKKCFVMEVENRDARTLLPIIKSHILPGTRIISDDWAVYKDLSILYDGIYSHDVVIHYQNFVNPEFHDVHTTLKDCGNLSNVN